MELGEVVSIVVIGLDLLGKDEEEVHAVLGLVWLFYRHRIGHYLCG